MSPLADDNLSSIIDHCKRDSKILPFTELVNTVAQIVQGLLELHQRSIVHQSIKPNNLLVYNNNGHKIIKLADYNGLISSDASD